MSTIKVTIRRCRTARGVEWRWSIRARNGRIIGASTEGYKRRGSCFKNLYTVTGFAVAKWRQQHRKFWTSDYGLGRSFLLPTRDQ